MGVGHEGGGLDLFKGVWAVGRDICLCVDVGVCIQVVQEPYCNRMGRAADQWCIHTAQASIINLTRFLITY